MKQHVTAFDGLRGLSAALVFAHHATITHGSRVGSEMFFVLSGFLITKSLRSATSQPVQSRGRSFVIFLRRRAWRLLPGLALLMLGLALVSALDLADRRDLQASLIAGLTFTMNWQRALTAWDGGALAHLWSLASEQQFYIVWPAILLLIPPAWVRPLIVCLLVASLVWRLVLSFSGAGIERIFNGLDTHPDGLLIGCLLATVPLDKVAGRWSQPLGVAVLALSLVAAFHLRIETVWAFSLATLVFALMAAFVVAAAMRDGLVSRVLNTQPLPGLGRISYGVYLWHYPVITLFRPEWPHGVRAAQMTLTLILAFVSYALVEAPALRRSRDAKPVRSTEGSPGQQTFATIDAGRPA